MRDRRGFPLPTAFLLAIGLLGPPAAHPQRARIATAAPVVQTRRVAVRPAPTRTDRPVPRNSRMFSNTLSGLNPSIGFGPNGFNGGMNDLNDIADQDLLLKAAIDPATQWRLATAERLLRDTRGFFPGFGGFLLDGGGSYIVPEEAAGANQPPPQAPQVIVVQAPPAPQPAVQPSPEPSAVTPAPLPDVGSFTLVLHDGKQIQAIAFSRIKDRIAYITPDGGRRTIEAADLDSDATVSVNQDRGTPLQLPR
jgi:hypothetical protein